MTATAKKMLSVFMAFVLVFTLTPLPASAESAGKAKEAFSEEPSDVSEEHNANGKESDDSQGTSLPQTSTDGTVTVKAEMASSATDAVEADASSNQNSGFDTHATSMVAQDDNYYETDGVRFAYTELAESNNVAIRKVFATEDKGAGQLTVTIPSTIAGKMVISLGTSEEAFSIDEGYKTTVGSISIPKEVQYIYSTSDLLSKTKLPNLKSVTFESGSAITALPDKFFANSNVSSVTLPQTLTAIGDEAFYQCTNLTSITIPNSVQSIGAKAFKGCSTLTSVTLGAGVSTIGEDAFDGTALTSVEIPDNVTTIGSGAFSIETLTAVKFGSGMETSKLKTIGDKAFLGTQLTEVEIPNTVESIGEQAFLCKTLDGGSSAEPAYGITTLKNVKLGTSQNESKLKTIGASAFEQAAITEIVLPNSLQSIGSGTLTTNTGGNGIHAYGAFSECTLLKKVAWPTELTENAMRTVDGFDRCVSLEDSVISSLPSWITTIAPGAFAENTFTDIQIPSTVTNIGDYAFAWLKTYNTANEISSITFDSGVESLTIGKHAFESASATIAASATIELPLRVTSVGENAFWGLRQTNNKQQGATFRVLYKDINVGTYGDNADDNVKILPFEPNVGTTVYYPSDATADSSFMKMKAAVETYESSTAESQKTKFIAEDPVPESKTHIITGTVPVGAKVFVHVTETYTSESSEAVTTTSSLDASVDATGHVTLGERVAESALVEAIVRLDGYEDYHVYPPSATQAAALTEDWDFTVEESALTALPKCTINGTVPEGATVQLIVGTKAETPTVTNGAFTFSCYKGTTVSAIVSLDGYLDYVMSPESGKESAPLNSDWAPTVTADMMTPLSKTGTLQVEADGSNRWFCTVAVFDSSGKIVAQQQTSTASMLVVDELLPGNYTAVAFQNNDFFSSITSVDDFAKMGIPDTSYVTGTATVKAQETTELTLTVPEMDTSALSSVISSGSVTASVTNAVPGSAFYARVTYQMGDGHPADTITVNVPDGLEVAAASTAAHAYGSSGWDSTTHQLTINPVGQDKQAATLFVALKATASGTFALSAAATSGTTTAPIGSVDIDVPPIRLDVPQGSLTSDTFDVTVYAQPLKQITFKIGGKELETTATTNLLGRATATLTIPAEVLNAYAYYRVEAAVEGDYPGSASANVYYDKVTSLQTATVREFKFFHGGQTVYLVRDGKDVPGYYTCIQKPRDHADLYSPTWPFTVVIDSAYELESTATLRLGMLDESVRNETMTLASVTDVSDEVGTKRYTYTADVAIGSGINHDLESNEIPATFDVVYTFADGDDSEFPQAVVDAMKQNYAMSRETWEHSMDAYKSDAATLTPKSQDVMKNLNSISYTEGDVSKTLDIGELTADDFNSVICRQGYKHGNWGQVGIQNPEGEWEYGFSAEDRAEYEEYEAALDEMFQLAADVMGQSVPLNACDSYEDYLQKNFGYSVGSPRDPAELERQGYTIIRDSDIGSVQNAGTLNASGQQVAPTWYAVKTADEGDSDDTGVRLSGDMTTQDATSGQAKGQASYYDSNGVSMQLSWGSVALDIAKENALPTAIGAADLYVGKLANKTSTQLANDIAWNTNLRTAKAAGSDTEIAKKFLELTGRSRTATQIKGMSELPVENTQKLAKNLKIAGYATAGVGLAFTAYQVKKNADRAGDLWSEAGDVAGQVDYLDMLRRRYTNLGMGLTPCFYAIQDEIKAARKLAEALRSEARWAEIDSAVSYGTTAVGIVVPGAGLATFGFGLGWGAFNSGWSASKAQELERLRQAYKKAKAHRENTCKGMQAKSLKMRKTPILDPSGYVYEAVQNNRLEGVTATISYQLENGTWQKWNAVDYDQINDQVTGEGGLFAWDVPTGTWKVEFSKPGYSTAVAIISNALRTAAATDDLTVLPEWSNISVGLMSTEAPTVADVSLDGDDVLITFSQFMKTAADKAPTVTVDDTVVACTWDDPVAGQDEEANEVQLSRVLRVPLAGLAEPGDTVTVAVSGACNYVGTQMATYTTTVTIPDDATYSYVAPDEIATYTKGSNEALSFTFKRSAYDERTFPRFQGILVDGAEVDASNYTAVAGSVIVTLKAAYLETLAEGNHKLTAQFEDGSATADFKVVASDAAATKAAKTRAATPSTGDRTAPINALLLTAAIACAVMLVARNRANAHKPAGKHTRR